MALTIPDWLVQSIQSGQASPGSGGILQSPLIGAAAGPPPAPAPIVAQNNNAGRGFGNFSASMGNGNAARPMNSPAPAAAQPQAPSLNQTLGLVPKMMQTFGVGNQPQSPTSQQGLLPRALQAFGIDPSSIGDNINLGLQDLGSGGAMTGLFSL